MHPQKLEANMFVTKQNKTPEELQVIKTDCLAYVIFYNKIIWGLEEAQLLANSGVLLTEHGATGKA
jgi:hypothetical protein